MIAVLSDFTDIATIVGVAAGLTSAAVAYVAWRHRTSHWLCIASPSKFQRPVDPDFWVFPPSAIDGERDRRAVVIAGKLINAGPSDAFSVHVFARPQILPPRPDREDESTAKRKAAVWGEALIKAAEIAAAHPSNFGPTGMSAQEVFEAFRLNLRTGSDFVSVLRNGDQLRFVVVAEYRATNPWIAALPSDAGRRSSCDWTHGGRQAHAVHASARTIVGARRRFGPDDLCAPFESGSWLKRAWFRARPVSKR